MEFGTIAYENKIYNLDYMNSEELKKFLNKIEEEKTKCFREAKKAINK